MLMLATVATVFAMFVLSTLSWLTRPDPAKLILIPMDRSTRNVLIHVKHAL